MATFIMILHGVDVGTVKPGVLIEMVVIAEKYQVPDLKEKSAVYAKQRLSNDNVIDALVVAHRIGVKDLEEAALKFITSNKLETDMKELNGFDDIPADISNLITQSYRSNN